MSLYNNVCPECPLSGVVVGIVMRIKQIKIDRPRDAYVVLAGDGVELALYTRCGGNNREGHADMYAAARAHPAYLRDEDDTFDSTFSTLYFRCPEPLVIPFRAMLTLAPYLAMTGPEKFQLAIAHMTGRSPEPPPLPDEEEMNVHWGHLQRRLEEWDDSLPKQEPKA